LKKHKMNNEKSFLYMICVGYLFVGMVSVIVIIALNILSYQNKQSSISEMNEAKIQKDIDFLDGVIAEMQETCADISVRNELENYARESKDTSKSYAYSRYRIYKMLAVYMKEMYRDIFVYFKEDEYIVSGSRSTLSKENYYKTYFSQKEDVKEDFYSLLECEYSYPILGSISVDGQEKCLYVAMAHSMKGSKEKYVVCVILNADYLSNQLFDYTNSLGTLLIFDNHRELLLNYGTEGTFSIDGTEKAGEPYAVEFDGNRYVMSVYPTQTFNGCYAYAELIDSYWKELRVIRLFSVFSVGAYVLLIGIVIYWMSRRAYQPLKSFIHRLSQGETEGVDRYQIKELNYIREVLQEQRTEMNKLYKEMKTTGLDKKERFLARLLSGYYSEEGDIRKQMKDNDIVFTYQYYVVGIIQIEEGSEDEKLSKFVIKNVFEEIFNRDNIGYVIEMKEKECAFLLNLEEKEYETKKNCLVEEGKIFIEGICQLRMTIAYSEVGKNIGELKELYMQAAKAMKYRYLYGKGSIIEYENIKNRSFTYINPREETITAMLTVWLEKEAQKITLKECINNIFSVCGINENISMETMECFRVNMVNCVNLVMIQKGTMPEDREKHSQMLFMKETLKEFEEYLIYVLALIRQEYTESEEGKNVCSRTKNYIDSNYMNPQLDLTYVAEKMGLSSSYLTKLYKNQYGVSVVEDITYIRIKNAKKFLLDTSLNVNEIAEKTGFSNGNVFGKVFKKYEGVTPGEFRKYKNGV